MKKIFISIPWFHPAFKAGGPVQSIANLVNGFQENTEYYIFCSNTDLNNTSLENIEENKWISYNAYTYVWYAGSKKRSDTIVHLTQTLKPDIIFIIGIFSWHFNIVPLLFCKAGNKILSVRGMLHPGALSQKRLKKKLFLLLWKVFDWDKKVFFHATNEEEKKYIERRFKDAHTFIAGNFPRKFKAQQIAKKAGQLKLVSIALISPMKNHLVILEALEQTPAIIEYHICGPVKDMEYWQACLEQMKQLPVNISVAYHGEVIPSAIEQMLHKAHVFILPSKSENFGHAFYEALSAGKPVITSHNTPWQDLEKLQAGLNVGIKVTELADAIAFFTGMSQDEYDLWKDGAVRYAEEAIDIEHLKEQYRKMFFSEDNKPEVHDLKG